MDAFEAALLAYFSRAVDVLDVEDATETVEDNFRQGGHELTRGHQHVDAILSRDCRENEDAVGEEEETRCRTVA